ncbi:hypothetical protein [Salinispora arenicola]|uniref:hypothetical protein n=1 Tax=Salinispora arenicola TaxID=168697 RepID=UPI0003674A11|nr:hypothetical protein [Salinispora arenicola]
MRELWFDLREAIARAEETITGYTAGTTNEPPEPWLVLDIPGARLWFTAVNAPRPRSGAIAAVHDDGPPPRAGAFPLYRQPLTEPDIDGENTLDQLRAAARQGHRWLVVDTSVPPRLRTAAAYDTDRVPETAVWTPGWLATGDLGPYPGQVAHGYQHNGSAVFRLTGETVQRIAADSNARPFKFPEQDADLLVLRHHDSSIEMFVVRVPGANTLGHHNEPFVVETRQLTAGPDGWYRLTAGRWPWRHASPPALPTARRRGQRRQHEPDVFEAEGPDGSRCTVCGATGYDIAHQELPSMAGYGTDTTTSCRICGSSETCAEEIGWSSHRTVWPPVLDPSPTADEEGTRP